ncbi:uncharacterized protein RB166_002624 [Leptodactylus fuscus]|uniref:uncharacterized protein LOC142194773 n=1 Tax=Leptodactylus fuscus TaxID=238119 RepID=UPI003F4EC4FC
MKKNSSMQGTLNKLFGKKSANNNSLYANNPPWVLPQGAKKASVDYHDDVQNSFAFLDDSGTATLKSRPGPRVRPLLNFSNSHTDAQGLAVPTPSVPPGFTDNPSIGNGSKLNGNYRMYSSVGDLRLHNYYDDYYGIPAPPSMPPPPPPTMPPPPPPQKSPPSSTISSPSSPSPPDFIPPNPNSTAPPTFAPADQYAVPRAEHYQTNVSKWNSETGLGAKDLPMTLPNRFSLNPATFQHNQGQTNLDVEPRSTLPKSFKIPPPAPTRTSSIQLQESQSANFSNDPPHSPVPSSFNPSVQAKLFATNQGQQSLNDILNKRKSMLIMEDLPDFLESSGQRIEKSANIKDTIGTRASSVMNNTNVPHNPQVDLNKEIKNEDAINGNKFESGTIFKESNPKQPYAFNNTISELTPVGPAKGEEVQKYSHNGPDYNTLTFTKNDYTQEMNKSSKPTVKVISLKPIIGDLSVSNPNGSKHNSLTRKEMEMFPQELTRIDNEGQQKPERILENVEERPPTPPPMAPPPPPPLMTVPPNLQSITPPLTAHNGTPPKTSPISNLTSPASPPAPSIDPRSVVHMPSPILPSKPKTITGIPKPPSFVPPPPAPPPLPSTLSSSSSVSLKEALQAKQQTLRKVPKSIEIRPAQTNSIPSVDDEQKIRVGKIKGELEALFSPKKDKGERLKNSYQGVEANKNSNGNISHSKGGENKLVNSLMMKVPLLPAKYERDDADTDNSEWLPKSNKMDLQIPEPDYLPSSPIHKTEKPTYLEAQKKIPKATLETSVPSVPVASPQKDTVTTDTLKNSMPTYKPHRESRISTESSTIDELPVVISNPNADVGLNLDHVSQQREVATLEPSEKQESLSSQVESTYKRPITGEQGDTVSPMALLMAAQKRAQKTKSLDKRNLPKISVTSGLITSSSDSNEKNADTFVPYKDNIGQPTEEEVTSFTSNLVNYSDSSSVASSWRNEELQSNINSSLGRNSEAQSDKSNVPYQYNSADVLVSTTDRYEEYLKPKSIAFNNHISTTAPSSTESPSFNIGSFPSPTPDSKMTNEIEYEIIPPPAEFMNSPLISRSNFSMQPGDKSYNFDHSTSLQSDLIPNYDRNNSVTQPYVSLSTTDNSGFNSYSSDNYNTGMNRDPQRSSLIKRRLYMPDPESSRNYGSNTSSLRSSTMPMSYSGMHALSSSNMVSDPRHSNTTSRFLPQGRRVSSENINRIVPPMTDMKYKSQNSDYSMGKSSTRAQSKYQQGMTFTVRPGTRQPISQMYQGGYL